MRVNFQDVDEVILGINAAYDALGHNGHTPVQNIDGCGGCMAMFLLRRAMEVYPTRIVRRPPQENTDAR
jgi:hypothetical protein